MQQILLHGVTLNQFLDKIAELIDSKVSGFAPQHTKQNQQSEFITRQEVSKTLKISLPTLHSWTRLGMLQSYKIGNRVLYKQYEVELALHKVASFKYKKGGLCHA